MTGIGKAIGMCFLLYVLVMVLGYIDANNTHLPGLPGAQPTVTNQVTGGG